MEEPLPPRKRFGSNQQSDNTRDTEVRNTDDLWLMRASEAYATSTGFIDTNLRKDWEDSTRHFQSKHMQGSKYYSDQYKYRSKTFRPKTRTSVRQNEAAAAAAFFSQLDVMTHEPEDDKDPMQLAGSALRQELINYRLSRKDQIPWFQVCVGGMQEANIYGVVVSKQFWDYEEKEVDVPIQGALNEDGTPAIKKQTIKVKDKPDIKLYPIENIRFDPAAEWTDVVNSSPYFIAMESMRVGDVKKKIKTGEWENVPVSTLLTARNSAYDSTRQARSGDKEDEKDSRYSKALSDFDLVWVHENLMRIEGDEYQYYTLSTLARLSKPKALKEAYLHGRRPFVVGSCVIEPHKAIPDSPVHIGKGLQKEANEISNSRQDNVKLALNKRYLVKRGKQVDLQSLVRNAAGSVTLVNDVEGDVRELEFDDVTASAYAEQDRINNDMDELLGSFSQGSVQTNRKLNETVGGMQMIRGASNAMTQYLIRIFSETWVEKVLNQVDMLEQYYESDMDLLNLMGRRADIGKYGIQEITKELLMVPSQIVVNVANSAMDPMIRLQAFNQAVKDYAEMRQMMPPDLNPEAIKEQMFGFLGYRDASKFSVEDDNPQLAAANQKIQQLQQIIDTKAAEAQAKEQTKLAQIQSDEKLETMRLQAEQSAQESEARVKILLAHMSEQTNILVAQIAADSKMQTAQASNETKALATVLQNNSNEAIAEMKHVSEMRQLATSNEHEKEIGAGRKGEFDKVANMSKVFKEIAESHKENSDHIEKIVKQLEVQGETLKEVAETHNSPRETTITERDAEGMPVRSVSRILKKKI